MELVLAAAELCIQSEKLKAGMKVRKEIREIRYPSEASHDWVPQEKFVSGKIPERWWSDIWPW